MEAQCQRLQVRSKEGGKVLFAADEEEVVMTSGKFTITGEKKLQSDKLRFKAQSGENDICRSDQSLRKAMVRQHQNTDNGRPLLS